MAGCRRAPHDHGMADTTLARQLGRLLRLERERRGWSQRTLAARAATSQQCVSRFEQGTADPTTVVIERLFRALGQQLRLDVEAVDADLDGDIESARAHGVDAIVLRLQNLGILLRRSSGLQYLVDGELAARLQGVPIPATRFDLAVAQDDLPSLSSWVREMPNWRRWDERWRDFIGWDVDPLRPGPLRWMAPLGEMRVRLLPDLPPPVVVLVEGREWPVRPLPAVERDDSRIGRFAARARAQSTLGSGGPSTSSASTIV